MNGGSNAATDGGSGGGATTDAADAAAATGPSESPTSPDSLTLAMQAIQGEEAAARLSPPGGGGSFTKTAGGELLLQENANSRGRQLSDEDQRPVNKRASSLKLATRQASCSEAEGHPVSKKAVRFADAMGLDLARVRHVFDLESPPSIPAQATRDLVLPQSDDEDDDDDIDEDAGDKDCRPGSRDSVLSQQSVLYLSPAFAQPGSAPNFNSRISAQKVVLEKAYYNAAAPAAEAPTAAAEDGVGGGGGGGGGEIRGLVRVANLGFEKSVRVRATFDSWQSSVEVAADYQPGGGGSSSDQFAFAVRLPAGMQVGDRVAFCVAYSVGGQTYWDSNFGDNYSFHCVVLDSPLVVPGHEQVWTRYV